MNARGWTLLSVFFGLGLIYALFFTEWLRPAPIEIASQVRFSAQPPRFGRSPPRKTNAAMPGVVMRKDQTNLFKPTLLTNKSDKPMPIDRIGWSDRKIQLAPGGVANVTFSLDDAYQLTKVKVQDLPADGSAPQVMWQVSGKSRPVRSLLYGNEPEGMKPSGPNTNVAPLIPGVPYRLILEAGRRRGTNDFTTAEAQTPG